MRRLTWCQVSWVIRCGKCQITAKRENARAALKIRLLLYESQWTRGCRRKVITKVRCWPSGRRHVLDSGTQICFPSSLSKYWSISLLHPANTEVLCLFPDLPTRSSASLPGYTWGFTAVLLGLNKHCSNEIKGISHTVLDQLRIFPFLFFSFLNFRSFWLTFKYESASFIKLTDSAIACHAKKHLMAHRTGAPQWWELEGRLQQGRACCSQHPPSCDQSTWKRVGSFYQ